jgi:hypothetical protein
MLKPNPAFLLVEKLKSTPSALDWMSRLEKKKTFRSTPSTTNCWTWWLCIQPKVEKRILSCLGGQFATPGVNVLAFISNLGPIRNPKMLKVGPKFFWALPPSVKRALCNPCSFHCQCCLQLFFNHKLHFKFYFILFSSAHPFTHFFCVKKKIPNALEIVQ